MEGRGLVKTREHTRALRGSVRAAGQTPRGHRRPYLQSVPVGELEAARPQADPLPGLGLYAVDALMVVVVVGREVRRQQRPFVSSDARPALGCKKAGIAKERVQHGAAGFPGKAF